MNAKEAIEQVEKALRKTGNDWIFGSWGEYKEKHLREISRDLSRFSKEYRKRFGETADPFLLLEENSPKGSAFFQFDTLRVSLEMKIAVWRILFGSEIRKIDFQYETGKAASFSITLDSPKQMKAETYRGSSPQDFRILRHLGIVYIGDELQLQGYFASKP